MAIVNFSTMKPLEEQRTCVNFFVKLHKISPSPSIYYTKRMVRNIKSNIMLWMVQTFKIGSNFHRVRRKIWTAVHINLHRLHGKNKEVIRESRRLITHEVATELSRMWCHVILTVKLCDVLTHLLTTEQRVHIRRTCEELLRRGLSRFAKAVDHWWLNVGVRVILTVGRSIVTTATHDYIPC